MIPSILTLWQGSWPVERYSYIVNRQLHIFNLYKTPLYTSVPCLGTNMVDYLPISSHSSHIPDVLPKYLFSLHLGHLERAVGAEY